MLVRAEGHRKTSRRPGRANERLVLILVFPKQAETASLVVAVPLTSQFFGQLGEVG
jgi:hypothetical protein